MEFDSILAVLVFFPFAAGLLAYFMGKRSHLAALISMAAELGLMAYLALLFYMRSKVMLLSYVDTSGKV